MKCTQLVKGRNVVCKALENAYVPSLFQLGEYCRSGEHRKCPLYLRGIVCANGKDGAVSVTPYFSGM